MMRSFGPLCFACLLLTAAAARAQDVAPASEPPVAPTPTAEHEHEHEHEPAAAPASEPAPEPAPPPSEPLPPPPLPQPSAAEVEAPSPLSFGGLSIDVHAFVSQGFILSTKNNYLARSKEGSLDFTEVAINFTAPITDELRVGLQLFTRKLGLDGNYIPVFDWAYADYRIADWFGIRVGKTKIPFGLYNESSNVDAARVPVFLPYSIYPTDTRELFVAVTGGELYGNIDLGVAGELEYRAYGGTFPFPGGPSERPGVDRVEIDVRYIVGGRLMWLTPLEGLQVSASLQALRYDTELHFDPAIAQLLIMAMAAPADFNGVVEVDFPIKLWVASAEYAVGDLLLAAEYGRWTADLESSQPAMVPNGGPTNERYYVMGSYRLSTWFVPGLLYSGYYLNIDDRKGREKHQHDLAATLRFDLTANWLLKLEAHWMIGTAALDSYRHLNEDKELKNLTREWTLFLIKTTAYF